MFGLPPLLAHIVEIVVFALVSLIGLGVGLRLLRVMRVDGLLGFGERVVFGLGVGYGALGFVMLGMGLVGVIYAPVGIVALLGLGGVGVGPLLREMRGVGAPIRSAIGGLRYGPNLFLLGVIGLCVGAALVKALVPVATQDDLMYHLALPRRYIEDHAVAFYPDSTYSLFPQLMEMLYTWGLLLGSDRLAVLFALGVGLLGPAAAGLFARRFARASYELRITNQGFGGLCLCLLWLLSCLCRLLGIFCGRLILTWRRLVLICWRFMLWLWGWDRGSGIRDQGLVGC